MEINLQKYSPKYICTCVKINLHLVPTKCKFTYVSKCVHMDEFAPVCKFTYMQNNLHMCKFGHENGVLVKPSA